MYLFSFSASKFYAGQSTKVKEIYFLEKCVRRVLEGFGWGQKSWKNVFFKGLERGLLSFKNMCV